MTKNTKDDSQHSKRMANIGEKVTLKKLGEVAFKELSLEALLENSDVVADVMSGLDLDDLKIDTKDTAASMQSIARLLKNEALLHAVKKLVASMTGLDADDFDDMGLTDWLKVIGAVKEVTDWEELRTVFSLVFPVIAHNLRHSRKKKSITENDE